MQNYIVLQGVQHLEGCLRQAQSVAEKKAAKLELAQRELHRATNEIAEQREVAECQQEQVDRLNSELDTPHLHMELEKLRAIESLHQEHQIQLR